MIVVVVFSRCTKRENIVIYSLLKPSTVSLSSASLNSSKQHFPSLPSSLHSGSEEGPWRGWLGASSRGEEKKGEGEEIKS